MNYIISTLQRYSRRIAENKIYRNIFTDQQTIYRPDYVYHLKKDSTKQNGNMNTIKIE